MSAVNASIILDAENQYAIRAHDGNGVLDPGVVIAAVEVGGLTIQSSAPGALRNLARALAEAEDRADAIRSTQPAAVVTS